MPHENRLQPTYDVAAVLPTRTESATYLPHDERPPRRDHYAALTAHSPTVRKSPSRLNDPPLGFIGSIPWRCNSMPYKDILSFRQYRSELSGASSAASLRNRKTANFPARANPVGRSGFYSLFIM